MQQQKKGRYVVRFLRTDNSTVRFCVDAKSRVHSKSAVQELEEYKNWLKNGGGKDIVEVTVTGLAVKAPIGLYVPK